MTLPGSFPSFGQAPPSPGWIPIQVFEENPCTVWLWVKPPTFPHGIVITFPPEEPRGSDSRLTMRSLVTGLGFQPEQSLSWVLNGMTFDSGQGANPLWDQQIPPVAPGLDAQIYLVFEQPQVAAMPAQNPAQPAATMQTSAAGRPTTIPEEREPNAPELELIDGMHAEWIGSLHMEADLLRQRKKMVDLSSKLKTLNRDLNTDERTYSSSQDKKDWQDSRRWLRDCLGKLARCLKDYDIGFTSSAGQRVWFEETYENCVEPKKPFAGMDQAFRDYQIYHKSLQNLNNSMKSAIQFSMQNGERRAQRVLNAIQAKVREGNAKKSFLGVITGS